MCRLITDIQSFTDNSVLLEYRLTLLDIHTTLICMNTDMSHAICTILYCLSTTLSRLMYIKHCSGNFVLIEIRHVTCQYVQSYIAWVCRLMYIKLCSDNFVLIEIRRHLPFIQHCVYRFMSLDRHTALCRLIQMYTVLFRCLYVHQVSPVVYKHFSLLVFVPNCVICGTYNGVPWDAYISYEALRCIQPFVKTYITLATVSLQHFVIWDPQPTTVSLEIHKALRHLIQYIKYSLLSLVLHTALCHTAVSQETRVVLYRLSYILTCIKRCKYSYVISLLPKVVHAVLSL